MRFPLAVGQSEKVLNAASQRLCNFQCEYGGGHIHAILNGVDAFSGNFCELRQLLLSEASRFACDLEVVQQFFVMLTQSDGPLSLLKFFDGVSKFLAGVGVEVARDRCADTDGAY